MDTAAPPEDLNVPPGMVAVSAVGIAAGDVEAAVTRALVLAGGLEAIQPGQTVFVKPNAVHPFLPEVAGIRTSGTVLGALVKLLKARGATVIVGDRCARGFSSEAALNDSGLTEAARAAGADEVYGAPIPKNDPDAWVLVQPAGWEATWDGLGGIQALRKIVEADHFINVAVCKDHRWGGFSLAMKNLIGAVGDESRDRMHYVANDVDKLSHDIVILNKAFNPLMNVIDAITCMVNGGPEGILGDEVITAPGLILASSDRVALDALGVALLQSEQARTEVPAPDPVQELLRTTVAWKLPQILRGAQEGVGVSRPEDVLLRFEGVAEPLATDLEARFRAT